MFRLPTQTPTDPIALRRVVTLLGHRAQGVNLRASRVEELVSLLGRYPDPTTAKAWKSELKSAYREVFAENGEATSTIERQPHAV